MRVQEIQCDRHDALGLSTFVPELEWDALVDFCAYQPEQIELVLYNLPGTLKQYIYYSTTTICENSLDLPMTEETPKLKGPLPGPHGDYGYKKWLTELKLKEICGEKGIHHTSLRPTFIYGKYNYAPREAYFFKLIAERKPMIVPLLPQSLFTMVSVWDTAQLTIASLANEKVYDNAYNLASPELISYDKLIVTLEKIIDRQLDLQRLPITKVGLLCFQAI